MPAPHAVVGLEQLVRVTDVVPPPFETVRVDGLPLVQPGDVVPRLIGRVSILEVLLDQSQVVALVEVHRGGAERSKSSAKSAFVTRCTSSALVSAIPSRIQSTIGRPPTGRSCFGIESVSGRKRVA